MNVVFVSPRFPPQDLDCGAALQAALAEYHATMGHEMFLTRHADTQDMHACVRLIQQRA